MQHSFLIAGSRNGFSYYITGTLDDCTLSIHNEDGSQSVFQNVTRYDAFDLIEAKERTGFASWSEVKAYAV